METSPRKRQSRPEWQEVCFKTRATLTKKLLQVTGMAAKVESLLEIPKGKLNQSISLKHSVVQLGPERGAKGGERGSERGSEQQAGFEFTMISLGSLTAGRILPRTEAGDPITDIKFDFNGELEYKLPDGVHAGGNPRQELTIINYDEEEYAIEVTPSAALLPLELRKACNYLVPCVATVTYLKQPLPKHPMLLVCSEPLGTAEALRQVAEQLVPTAAPFVRKGTIEELRRIFIQPPSHVSANARSPSDALDDFMHGTDPRMENVAVLAEMLLPINPPEPKDDEGGAQLQSLVKAFCDQGTVNEETIRTECARPWHVPPSTLVACAPSTAPSLCMTLNRVPLSPACA